MGCNYEMVLIDKLVYTPYGQGNIEFDINFDNIEDAIMIKDFSNLSMQGDEEELRKGFNNSIDQQEISDKIKKYHIANIANSFVKRSWENALDKYPIRGFHYGNFIKIIDGQHRIRAAKHYAVQKFGTTANFKIGVLTCNTEKECRDNMQ